MPLNASNILYIILLFPSIVTLQPLSYGIDRKSVPASRIVTSPVILESFHSVTVMVSCDRVSHTFARLS